MGGMPGSHREATLPAQLETSGMIAGFRSSTMSATISATCRQVPVAQLIAVAKDADSHQHREFPSTKVELQGRVWQIIRANT